MLFVTSTILFQDVLHTGIEQYLFIFTFLGFIKTVLYSCFMVIMIKVHTFPLFAIRPMYLTLR